MIGYWIFYVRYNSYMYFKKLFEPKRREYMFFILGRYPENFRNGINAVIDGNSILRYSIGQTCVVVRFTSIKTADEIETLFNTIYSGYMDNYFLFEVVEGNYGRGINTAVYKHLYDPEYNKMTVAESLDKIEHFFIVINKMRAGVAQIMQDQRVEPNTAYNENNTNTENTIISMDDINPILDKIKAHGMESLTEQEKQTLKKYANND